jgi:glycosyltransferase involved in cell wall biosynthesis
LHKFVNGIVSLADKDRVIKEYELRFAPSLKAGGLNCVPIFPSTPGLDNRTIYDWNALLKSGFPFIKVMTIRDRFPRVDVSNWREMIAEHGYDVSIAERTLAEADVRRPESPTAGSIRPPSASVSFAVAPGPVKVAFIGPWNYNNGLGIASRGYVSALRRTEFQVNFYPIRRPFHIHRQIAPAVDICDFSGDADIAVVHLNPDAWPGLLTEAQKEIVSRAKRRVGLWVWEMADIPENWRPVFDEVDAIWAPSHYCAEVFAAKSRVPVEVIPHVVRVDRSIPDAARAAAMREELALSQRDRVILYAFDGSSYLVRKNPFALVNAFARSGLAKRGWKLVLKTKHADDSPEAGKRLEQLVGSSAGVLLIDRIVSKGTMDELMRAADIYASPHCAEGFGLTIAEAMAMGKIVVATDYSGSRDFLDADCGFPVGYRLQSLDDDHGHYRRGGVWAQVDESRLADALVKAADQVMAGDKHIGEAARARIEDRLSLETVGAKMRQGVLRLLAGAEQ